MVDLGVAAGGVVGISIDAVSVGAGSVPIGGSVGTVDGVVLRAGLRGELVRCAVDLGVDFGVVDRGVVDPGVVGVSFSGVVFAAADFEVVLGLAAAGLDAEPVLAAGVRLATGARGAAGIRVRGGLAAGVSGMPESSPEGSAAASPAGFSSGSKSTCQPYQCPL